MAFASELFRTPEVDAHTQMGATSISVTELEQPDPGIQESLPLPETRALPLSCVGDPWHTQAPLSVSRPYGAAALIPGPRQCVASVHRQSLLAGEPDVSYGATCRGVPATSALGASDYSAMTLRKAVAPGEGGLDVLSMFPYIFTFSCCLVFLVPSWLTYHNGHDPSVRHFFQYWWQIVLLFPILFFGGHIMHVRKRGPWKPVVFVCTLVPSISLVMINNSLLTLSSDISDQLFSVDCDTTPEKRELDRAWHDAHKLYVRCLDDTVAQSEGKLTLEKARELYRIEDCEEYPHAYRYQTEMWSYLAYCEEDLACSGWCEPGPRLWTFRETQDSCNVAVSSVFAAKVHPSAKNAVFYSVAVLVMVSVGIVIAGPFLRARSIAW